MTDEQLKKRFQQLEDRTYELECDRNRLEYKIEDLESLCSRLEDKITDIGWRT
jgi:predicted  nucleic acid-binding Zn-ribbon protein